MKTQKNENSEISWEKPELFESSFEETESGMVPNTIEGTMDNDYLAS
jgi:hypothetical protein